MTADARHRGPVASPLRRSLARVRAARHFDRTLVADLTAAATDAARSWRERQAEAFLLEHLVMRIAPDGFDDFAFVFELLGLGVRGCRSVRFHDWVRREGFSSAEFDDVCAGFRRRLEPRRWAHDALDASPTSATALRRVLRFSRAACKLFLARYLFTPEETAARIRRLACVTRGRLDGADIDRGASDRLPAFEAAILRELCADGGILWATARTPSELNGLVEYPFTSASLVVKPPGSAIELQFKRAGTRGAAPLRIVFDRDGVKVPATHRLFGGLIRVRGKEEAAASVRFDAVRRAVRSTDARLSSAVSFAIVAGVPSPVGEQSIERYVSDPGVYGEGFESMCRAADRALDAFLAEEPKLERPPTTDVGSALALVRLLVPSQMVLCGTTSFRVDTLARYLADDGPEIYFSHGLRHRYTADDATHLADQLLEQILGHYRPPPGAHREYREYVKAAFAIEANRRQADRVFLEICRQLGECWGALMSVGGFSKGESFVARNVGIAADWTQGSWSVRLVLMDHDGLSLPSPGYTTFRPRVFTRGVFHDASHLLGIPPAKGTLTWLSELYRVTPGLANEGLDRLRASAIDVARAADLQLDGGGALAGQFHPSFVAGRREWEAVVTRFLCGGGAPADEELRRVLDENAPFLRSMRWYFERRGET